MAKASGRRRIASSDRMPTHSSVGAYDIAPTFPLGPGQIASGYGPLAEAIAAAARDGARRITLDGFASVLWEQFRELLEDSCRGLGLEPAWRDMTEYLLPESELRARLAPNLGGDDPLFGKLYEGRLADFFDVEQLCAVRDQPVEGIVVFYGPGAVFAGAPDLLVYVDVPKDVIQQRMREGAVTNLGARGPASFGEMYKRAYFIDWPALNRHKAQLLPGIDLFVDAQNPAEPTFISGHHLRAALDEISTHPFRVRPWFSPGPWGGQWMKTHFQGLDRVAPNYAWSFELIVPENGLVLESDEHLECSFDLLMFQAHERVLGRAAARFGYNFPLRVDYLDTFGGGNLSIQCHPRPAYIREKFGEPFTQDESYYITTCEPGARVYLGFRDDAAPDEFRTAVEYSSREGEPIDIDRYVNSVPSRPHDLFLIPHGTIHASGVGNLVLEISATPYIYTFKIYDWVRRDLDGKLRPLNIERAWDNLYFERREGYVGERLRPQPQVLREGPGWRELLLGTHEDIFYAVHRYELEGQMTVETDGRCHVLNVVEGLAVVVRTPDGRSSRYNYGETFVVPAAAGEYRLMPVGGRSCKVVMAFVK